MTKQEFQEIIKEKAEGKYTALKKKGPMGTYHQWGNRGFIEGANAAYDLLSDGWINAIDSPPDTPHSIAGNSYSGNYLVYSSKLECVIEGSFEKIGGKFGSVWLDNDDNIIPSVTHYMPLPQPPTKTKQ